MWIEFAVVVAGRDSVEARRWMQVEAVFVVSPWVRLLVPLKGALIGSGH